MHKIYFMPSRAKLVPAVPGKIKPVFKEERTFHLQHGPVLPNLNHDRSFEDVVANETKIATGVSLDLHKIKLTKGYYTMADLPDPTKHGFDVTVTNWDSVTNIPIGSPPEATGVTDGYTTILTGNGIAYIKKGSGPFQSIDPSATFAPGSAVGDQTVVYIPSISTFVWVMLCHASSNVVKVAFISSADSQADNPWTFGEITPGQLGAGGLDYPCVAYSDESLYISIDCTNTTPSVARIPLSQLKPNLLQGARVWSPPDGIQYVRACSKTTSTAYLAGHLNDSTLSIFAWPEGPGDVTQRDLSIPSFSAPSGGGAWLDRASTCEFTGSAFLKGRSDQKDSAWFAWNAVNPAGSPSPMTLPFCAVAEVDVVNWTVQMHYVWSKDWPLAYPALAAQDDANEMGISYVVGIAATAGGTTTYPLIHGVGLLTLPVRYSPIYQSDPYSGHDWGDYFGINSLYNSSSALNSLLCRFHSPNAVDLQLTNFGR